MGDAQRTNAQARPGGMPAVAPSVPPPRAVGRLSAIRLSLYGADAPRCARAQWTERFHSVIFQSFPRFSFGAATFHVPRCACVLILCACASVSVPALPSLDMSPSLRASSRDARPRPRRDLACSAACRPNRYRSCSWDGGRPWLRRRRPRRGRRRASRREQPASI